MSLSPEQSPQTRNSPPLDHGEGAPFSNGTKNQGNISFLLTPRQSEQAFFFCPELACKCPSDTYYGKGNEWIFQQAINKRQGYLLHILN